MQSYARNALLQYGQTATTGAVETASPHRLIQMLLLGAMDKVAIARGAMMHRNVAEKGQNISWAIAIIDSLRASLNHELGGELADNLAALYEYMGHRLLLANLRDDVAALDEVATLLRQIKSGWDGIAEQVST